MTIAALRLILGDQLSPTLAALKDCDKARDIIVLCEVWEEATYVRHHKKKIAFIFSAMRHFAQELQQDGYRVHYTKLDDPDNAGSFTAELQRLIALYKPQEIITTHPGEYRVLQDMQQWSTRFGLPVDIRDDDRFLCDPREFATWAKDRKTYRMEYFYREMRQRHDVLMQNSKPIGGVWNFDHENREVAPKNTIQSPPLIKFAPDQITQQVLQLVEKRFADHFGDLYPFDMAVTRDQALMALQDFMTQRLPQFGQYQDVMQQGQPFLYHAHIGAYLNCGLLLPREVIDAAEAQYHEGNVPINAAEGFIRQVLGWREFVRGLYWLKVPEYAAQNFLQAKRPLPSFYWDGETDMNCLRQCITETKQNAYAHHIQRLMVLGNFALLAGIDPTHVNEWFLIVYMDAYEWVELPNVTGMALFADGGVLASKPYAASGAYINKMSNYCKGCRYKVQEKNGADACPFNYLYWDFMQRNKDVLEKNQRLSFVYKTLRTMNPDKLVQIQTDSQKFFKTIDA